MPNKDKNMNVTYEDVRSSEEIRTYIKQADESLKAIGYTEHSFAHCTKVAKVAGDLLEKLEYDAHEVELARIAGFMHDIGNVVNRIDHAQSGAMMAFRILDKMGMPPEDVATVITAIGNHDEQTAAAVNAVAAALIIADKTDVRRSRVRNRSTINFDIHDRVNYAAEKSDVILEPDSKTITLDLKINTEICAVMDYFEIFTGRMLLCRKAAEFLGLQFKLDINDVYLL
jgi:putative nucleotidyltransferase with HDIG domain